MPDHDRQPVCCCRSNPFIHICRRKPPCHRPITLSHLVECLLVRHLDPLQQFDGVLGALEARALDAEVVPQLLDAPLDRVPEALAVPARPAAPAYAAAVVLALRRIARRLLVVLKSGKTKTGFNYAPSMTN